MISIKDPIEEYNNKACRDIDEHNKNVPLKQKAELNKEMKSYSGDVFKGKRYFMPSETYRQNWVSIFAKKNV